MGSASWDDDDEGDGQQTYACNSAGHVGHDRDFEAAPEEWYEEKGLSPPRHCPDCRDWIREQEDAGDVTITCAECHVEFVVSANRRISHHKGTGPWVYPRYCDGCEHDSGRRNRRARDDAKRRYKELRRKGQPAPRQPEYAGLEPAEPLEIPDTLDHYLSTSVFTDGRSMTTMDHIMRHPEFAHVSREHVLHLMLSLAASTSSSVRQVVGRKGRINKGDKSTGYVLIVDPSKDPPPFMNFFKRKNPKTTFGYLKDQI